MVERTDLDRLLAELGALRERVERQEVELQRLRARPAPAPAAGLDAASVVAGAIPSRRGVLTGAAVALGALGLAVAPATAGRARADQLAAAMFFVPPTRVVDTRPSSPGIVTTGFDGTSGAQIAAGPVTGGTTRRFLINGKTFAQGNTTLTLPQDISGILCNLTTVGGPAGGFVTLFPGNIADANRPLASTLNPVTSPAFNFAAVTVSPTGAAPNYGTIAVFSTLTLDVIVDVVGYFF